jgi:hypothetical protein
MDVPIIIFSLTGIYALWTFGFRKQLLDYTRSKLFSLRSSLFNLAADGKIKFNDPVYRQTELYLNTLLKYTHRANILRILVRIKSYKNNQEAIAFSKSLTENINNLQDAEVKVELNKIVQTSGYIILRYVINSNIATLFIFWFIIMPLFLLFFKLLFFKLLKIAIARREQGAENKNRAHIVVIKNFAESLLQADAYCSFNNCNI